MKSFAEAAAELFRREFYVNFCFSKNIRWATVFSVAFSVAGFVGRERWIYEKARQDKNLEGMKIGLHLS